jgi:hypothetical protein
VSAVPDWLETFWHHAQTNDHVCGHQPSIKATLVLIAEYCLMKKQLITSVSVLTLAFAAQAHANSSTVVQKKGSSNEAVVTQRGGIEGESDILQKGSNNTATVTQGEDRVGISDYFVAANTADIDQEGDDARAVIVQRAWNTFNNPNAATINQLVIGSARTGNGYTANGVIRQIGIYNTSTIDQAGSGISARSEQDGRRNTSVINQTETSADPMTRAIAYQDGDRNSSTIYQTGSGARAAVSQRGNDNRSTVDQSFRSGMLAIVSQISADSISDIDQNATDVTADVTQYGSTQDSYIWQKTGSIGSSATVIQENSGNDSDIIQKNRSAKADVTQRGTGGLSTIEQINRVGQRWYGIGGTAKLTDRGADNKSSIYQTGDLYTATATVKMDGSDNKGLIEQGVQIAGTDMTATVSQKGMNGYSEILQGGGSGSIATLTQSGNDNDSYIWQDYGTTTAKVTQSGDDNYNNIWQYDADGSTATVQQLGTDSRSTIYQTGLTQEAVVLQGAWSSDSRSRINQYGEDHVAMVKQNSAGNISRIKQWGSTNTAKVYQVVQAGNLSVIRQRGSNNTATVNQ